MIAIREGIAMRPDENGAVLYEAATGKVLECNRAAWEVLRLLDGSRSVERIAAETGASAEKISEMAELLKEAGAAEESASQRKLDIRENAMTPPLRTVTIEITKTCNLKCAFCYADAGEQLSWKLEEVAALAKDLRNNGVLKVIITGGEPTMHPQLVEIIGVMRAQGLGVELLSNGTRITPELARKLKGTDITKIRISLDGAKAETHDAIRGMKGAWEKTIQGIRNCKAAGIYTEVNMVVCNRNIGEITDVYDLCQQLGVDRFYSEAMVLLGRGKRCGLEITPAQYNEANAKLLKKANIQIAVHEGLKETSCGVGFLNAAVNVRGQLIPCPLLQELQAGDVKKNGIKARWEGSDVMKGLRASTWKNIEKCSACEHKLVCRSGCKARVFGMTGKLDESDSVNCALYRGE
ncbi:MAG: radical SAM protein [Candidatus Micrarchaeota archaeon]